MSSSCAPSILLSTRWVYWPALPSLADDTAAINAAIKQASAYASSSGLGVAVFMPAGTYKVSNLITIKQSNVVLRGAGVS